MRTRPLSEMPSLLNRASCCECFRSSHSSASGSAKTVTASSKATPCFLKFLVALRASQVNTIYVYTIIVGDCQAFRAFDDNGCVLTYTQSVKLNLILRLVAQVRKKAQKLSLLQHHWRIFAGEKDAERSIAEFERLSGGGHSRGWRFRRDEIHER
jgi:hypothetical protein